MGTAVAGRTRCIATLSANCVHFKLAAPVAPLTEADASLTAAAHMSPRIDMPSVCRLKGERPSRPEECTQQSKNNHMEVYLL